MTFGHLRAKAVALWRLLLNERSAPHETAWAVALGVWIGTTPALGFHGWMAVGLASLFRLSRLWTFVGSRVSNFVILPWIVWAEVTVAHRLRTGDWMHLDRAHILDRWHEVLLDWTLGCLTGGVALAAIFGAGTYAILKRGQRD